MTSFLVRPSGLQLIMLLWCHSEAEGNQFWGVHFYHDSPAQFSVKAGRDLGTRHHGGGYRHQGCRSSCHCSSCPDCLACPRSLQVSFWLHKPHWLYGMTYLIGYCLYHTVLHACHPGSFGTHFLSHYIMRCACCHPSAADEALRYNVFHASFKVILNQYRLLHCSYVYAPYQVLKKCGIKGPEPSAFFGNYRLQKKMVGSCDAEMYIHVECMVLQSYSGKVMLVAAFSTICSD